MQFTATTNFFFVLTLKPTSDAPTKDVYQLFLDKYAPKLWETYGEVEIYVSPDRATAESQIDLLFPDIGLTEQVVEAPPMTHVLGRIEPA